MVPLIIPFGTDGKVITDLGTAYGYSNSAVLQPDGRIDVTWNLYNGKNTDFVIVRYNNNGSLDKTFGSNGIASVDFNNSNDLGSAIALQSDGKIIAAGSSDNGFSSDFALLRYNTLYPVFQISSASIQFGDVFIDSSSTKSFFIKNSGSSNLNIDSIVSENNAFIINQNIFSLTSGDSQKVDITFTPTQAQTYNEKLIIYHNAAGNPDTLLLSGNGVVKTSPQISLSSTTVDFGTITVGNTAQKSIFIKNTGTASLKVDSIITNNPAYSIDKKNLTLTPGDSQEVKLTFTPDDTTVFNGNLNIYHNASGSPSIINLTGRGTSKAMAVIALSTTFINFGSVIVNNNLQKNFFVKNTGTAELVIDSITNNNNTIFSVNPSKFNVASGDSQEVKVTFTPTDTSVFNGRLSVFHNASGSPGIINLSGKGTSKAIAIINLSESKIDFGIVTINKKLQKLFLVKNKGTATLLVDSMSINNSAFSIDSVKFNVAPGDSQEVKVTFTPKDSITYNAVLNIFHNASGSPAIINLTGKGTLQNIPIISLSKETLNFGEVTINNSSIKTFNISNTGTADLLIDSIKSSNNIFIANIQNFIIKPDSNQDVTVTFSPKDSIVYNSILSIYNNTLGSPGTINLTGKGVSPAKAIINLSSTSLVIW